MSRNIVRDYINYDKECMHNYINVVTKKKLHSKIVDEILNTYVDVRYYNIYDQKEEYPWKIETGNTALSRACRWR